MQHCWGAIKQSERDGRSSVRSLFLMEVFSSRHRSPFAAVEMVHKSEPAQDLSLSVVGCKFLHWIMFLLSVSLSSSSSKASLHLALAEESGLNYQAVLNIFFWDRVLFHPMCLFSCDVDVFRSNSFVLETVQKRADVW